MISGEIRLRHSYFPIFRDEHYISRFVADDASFLRSLRYMPQMVNILKRNSRHGGL